MTDSQTTEGTSIDSRLASQPQSVIETSLAAIKL